MKTGDATRLLLLSTSKLYGREYLDHAEAEIRDFLGRIRRVLFVPFAIADQDGYATKARECFTPMGYGLDSLHEADDKQRAVSEAEAIFIGGGNTFRLLKALYDYELLPLIKTRVGSGMPYMGASAGSNVAGPTIRTTNDMPIVEPPSFNALGLVAFQINPHYLDPDPASTHMGETREERLIQFLEENDTTVVGLREGAWLRIEAGSTMLKGSSGARIFCKGQPPVEESPGSDLTVLLYDH
jgi:dipeptidase E